MSRSTRNLLRILSIIIVLVVVLIELDVLKAFIGYRIWWAVGAYGLLLFATNR